MSEISPETKYFMRIWNSLRSPLTRERYIKNHFKGLYFNRDMVDFLEEFVSQFEGDRRMQMMCYCKKVLLQVQPEIDPNYHKSLEAEQEHQYNTELSNDIQITGLDWINAEIECFNQIGDIRKILQLLNMSEEFKPKQELSLTPVDQKELLSQDEILNILGISKKTFDRRRQDSELPAFNVGKKIYSRKKEFFAWLSTQEKQTQKLELIPATRK